MASIYILNQYNQQNQRKQNTESKESLEKRKRMKTRLILDIMKDSFDFPCALEGTFQRGTFNNGIIGICASISSFIGLYLAYPQ